MHNIIDIVNMSNMTLFDKDLKYKIFTIEPYIHDDSSDENEEDTGMQCIRNQISHMYDYASSIGTIDTNIFDYLLEIVEKYPYHKFNLNEDSVWFHRFLSACFQNGIDVDINKNKFIKWFKFMVLDNRSLVTTVDGYSHESTHTVIDTLFRHVLLSPNDHGFICNSDYRYHIVAPTIEPQHITIVAKNCYKIIHDPQFYSDLLIWLIDNDFAGDRIFHEDFITNDYYRKSKITHYIHMIHIFCNNKERVFDEHQQLIITKMKEKYNDIVIDPTISFYYV